jgi:hypothetical protein
MIQTLYKLQPALRGKGRLAHEAVLKIYPEQGRLAWVDREFNQDQSSKGC